MSLQKSSPAHAHAEHQLLRPLLTTLQIGFPIIAILLLITLLAWPKFRILNEDFPQTNLLNNEEQFLGGRAQLDAEKIVLEGRSANNIDFRLHAEHAEARITAPPANPINANNSPNTNTNLTQADDLLRLSKVRLVWGNTNPLQLRADTAQHSPSLRLTHFSGDVAVTADDDTTHLFAAAGQANWQDGTMTLNGPVHGNNRDGQFNATDGAFVVGAPSTGASRLVLLGKTRLEFLP